MAGFIENIKVLIDVDSSKASGALKGIHRDITETGQKFETLKGTSGGIFDTMKAAAPLALAGVGTAVAGFAIKAVGDFQHLALEVDNFKQKTGTSAEAASRWIEVGHDLGVQADTVATAFGKFERADVAGTLKKYGLTATDTSGRFAELLGKIGAIPDEGERAAAAFKVFGRSWQELAPLLDSTEDLNKRLKEVGKGQIVTDSQIANARKFRDAMDDLNDRLAGFTNTVGATLVPILTNIATKFGQVADAVDTVLGPLGGVANVGSEIADKVFTSMTDPIGAVTAGFFDMGDAADAITTGFGLWGDSSDDANTKMTVLGGTIRSAQVDEKEFAATTKKTTEEQAALTAMLADQAKRWTDLAASERDAAKAGQEQIDAQRAAADAFVAVGQASDSYQTFLDGLNKEITDAGGNQQKLNDINREAIDKSTALADSVGRVADEQATAAGTTQTATGKLDTWNTSMLGSASHLSGPLLSAVLGYIGSVNEIPPEKLTEIQALIEQGKLDEAKAKLDEASKARKVAVTADANTSQAEQDLNHLARDRFVRLIPVGGGVGVYAEGGDVSTGLAWVGEQGPELVALPIGTHVFTATQSKAMAGIPRFASGGDLYIPELGDQSKALEWAKYLAMMQARWQAIKILESGGYTPDQMYTSPGPFGGYQMPAAYGVSYTSSSATSGRSWYSDASGATSWTVPVKGGLSAPGPSAAAPFFNITVNAGLGTDGADVGQQIVEVIKRYERRAGFAWRN